MMTVASALRPAVAVTSAVMTHILFAAWFVSVFALVPAQELGVQRVAGDRTLTATDEVELARLMQPHGRPWLIVGPEQGQFSGTWSVRVYLQPADGDAPIRRGKVLYVRATAPPGAADLEGWGLSVFDYVQVPMDRSRPLSLTSTDLPFNEWHTLPDADLQSLVAFVRSSPRWQNTTIDGARPVRSIRRSPSGDIEVGVMIDRWSTWVLTLRPNGATWQLVHVGMVVA